MKNYTSTVAPEKSIMQIEQLLIKAGARHISKEYGATGEVVALSFSVVNPETTLPVFIRLPSDTEAAYLVLQKGKANFRWWTDHQKQALREQAKRSAWRLLWDWVAVQLSMIEMKQAEMVEVFLPYIWNGQASLFQQLKASQTPAIGYRKTEVKEEEEGDVPC
jgi:hypothetical protein